MAWRARCSAFDAAVWRGLAHFRGAEPQTRRCSSAIGVDDPWKGQQGARRAVAGCRAPGDRRVREGHPVYRRQTVTAVSFAAWQGNERTRGAAPDGKIARSARSLGTRYAACLAPLLCDPSARQWRRSAQRAGTPRPRLAVYHADLHPDRHEKADGSLRKSASARVKRTRCHGPQLRATQLMPARMLEIETEKCFKHRARAHLGGPQSRAMTRRI